MDAAQHVGGIGSFRRLQEIFHLKRCLERGLEIAGIGQGDRQGVEDDRMVGGVGQRLPDHLNDLGRIRRGPRRGGQQPSRVVLNIGAVGAGSDEVLEERQGLGIQSRRPKRGVGNEKILGSEPGFVLERGDPGRMSERGGFVALPVGEKHGQRIELFLRFGFKHASAKGLLHVVVGHVILAGEKGEIGQVTFVDARIAEIVAGRIMRLGEFKGRFGGLQLRKTKDLENQTERNGWLELQELIGHAVGRGEISFGEERLPGLMVDGGVVAGRMPGHVGIERVVVFPGGQMTRGENGQDQKDGEGTAGARHVEQTPRKGRPAAGRQQEEEGDGEADGRQVGITVGHGINADDDDANDGEQKTQKRQPTDEFVGLVSPAHPHPGRGGGKNAGRPQKGGQGHRSAGYHGEKTDGPEKFMEIENVVCGDEIEPCPKRDRGNGLGLGEIDGEGGGAGTEEEGQFVQ
ncbi:MAG: hypothetical protein EOM10_04420 [Opitutae bacterium]|nr:hypothetical protein [Opitutae bacterium]